MTRFVRMASMLSALLFSMIGVSMESLPSEFTSNEEPPELSWLAEQPEWKSFALDISPEKAEEYIEKFWDAGFNKKWEYFWQSDDEFELKKIAAKTFYEDMKEYWKKNEQAEGVQLLVWSTFTLGWGMAKAAETMEIKKAFPQFSWNPMIVIHARALMCDRILNEKSEVIADRIKAVTQVVVDLHRHDLREAQKAKNGF